MATTVRITETYDLKTTVNRIGIIGIHTPTTVLLQKMYPGLVKNHEFVRFLKCDVTGACASVLPADPLQVGVSNGDVAPEDMFNPILYRAVTNESFDTLMARINNTQGIGGLGSVNSSTLGNDGNAFDAYYGLLADNKRFRKVMPQNGFSIRGLMPICHLLMSSYGNVSMIGNTDVLRNADDPEQGVVNYPVPDLVQVPVADGNLNSANPTSVSSRAVVFRGKSVRMPKIPLHYAPESPNAGSIPDFQIPKTFVLAMIIPPARLHEFYYRMRVTWTVRFERVVSAVAYENLYYLAQNSTPSYYKGFNYQTSKSELESNENLVDTDNVTINKIMEA